jgi:hypothetical protein
MASLLAKFRIDYQSLKMVSGITEKPRTETVNFFNQLLEGFHEEDNGNAGRTQFSGKHETSGTSQNADT